MRRFSRTFAPSADDDGDLEAIRPAIFNSSSVGWEVIEEKRRCVIMADHEDVRRDLRKVINAKTEMAARSAARAFKERWEKKYPGAVKCLRNDLDELVTCWHYKTEQERKAVRTTNHIERCFVELRRRTRPMGVFQNKTSLERILYAVFAGYNKNQGTRAPSQC